MATSYAKNLTHEALSKSHLDRCSTTALTRSFVASQAQHASAYAIEGKKVASRWNSGPGSEIRSSTSAAALIAKTNPLGGGFSSPILKPRNPKSTEGSQPYLHTPPVEKTTGNKSRSGKILFNGEERKNEKTAPDKTVNKQSRSLEQGARELKVKGKTSNTVRQKRNRVDSDDERNESKQHFRIIKLKTKLKLTCLHTGLKLRRIRRQNKKEIVTAPKACTEETSIASGDEAEEPRCLKRKSKLPAGLALMHGFSAGNIGKNRLTVRFFS